MTASRTHVINNFKNLQEKLFKCNSSLFSMEYFSIYMFRTWWWRNGTTETCLLEST